MVLPQVPALWDLYVAGWTQSKSEPHLSTLSQIDAACLRNEYIVHEVLESCRIIAGTIGHDWPWPKAVFHSLDKIVPHPPPEI